MHTWKTVAISIISTIVFALTVRIGVQAEQATAHAAK